MAVRIISEARRAARRKAVPVVPGTIIVRSRPHRDERGASLPCDAYGQSISALRGVIDALAEQGVTMHDVRYTRIHVSDVAAWTAIGRAHDEYFREFNPVSTMMDAVRTLDRDVIVEFEVHAVPGKTPRKGACERCGASLGAAAASRCGWNCTFCADCTAQLGHRCPNCGGALCSIPID
jgi:enamine deaminase RidA (YjgF/YER057c/UK114 family)